MGRKFIRMTLSDEDMKQALFAKDIDRMPMSRQEAEDKLLAIGWIPNSQHIAKYNEIRAKQEEFIRQQRVASQEIIISHADLVNLGKFSERDLRKWIDDNKLEADACDTKEDYMDLIDKNHTFVSPVPRVQRRINSMVTDIKFMIL